MCTKSIVAPTKTIARRATIGDMGNDLLDTTGTRIKWARIKAGLTQTGLGHLVGVRNVYISQLETGTHHASRTLMNKLAMALNVSRSFLELETDDPTPPQSEQTETPIYFSAEADEVARIIDTLNESQRALVLNIVRVIAAHAAQMRAGTPATGMEGAQLILGKLLSSVNDTITR
jgi:transcriptional regulator with XRE-family HTH domain